jgi:cytochrome c-type biogenesis protein CcmF
MVEFGFFALIIGFILATYSFVVGILSLKKSSLAMALSSRNALLGVTLSVFIGAITLWFGLLSNDFSIRYVFRNSAVDMPPLYLMASFWSSLEGSHLLWTLLICVMSSIGLITIRSKNLDLLPGLCVAFGMVQTFMLLLLVWASAPLTRLFPLGQFGAGMNPLLQNPYMAAHPPSLFSGYSALIVPFAYCFAALTRGSLTSDWIVSVRRWTLAAWAILTIGIFLGGKWAYVELGWAGYWAWDPVENSSFMPWLAATAALHSLLVLDKLGRLPRLTIFLSQIAFILTFLGTFITRSGVISSVHSFAESNIGPAYLAFICVLLSACLLLLFTKGYQIQGAAKSNVWTLSKESSLLFTNFFLIFLLALVCVGTLLPLIVEAVRGTKISIQQPFFNAFAPWVGIGLVGLVGIGNLMRWRNGKIDDPVVQVYFPILWGITLGTVIWVKKDLDFKSGIGFVLILWSFSVLVMDLIYKLKEIRWNGKAFLKFNRTYFGAWIVHVGFLVAIAGFLGGYRGLEQQTTLKLGESVNFYGYEIKNDGLGLEQNYNATYVHANLATTDARKNQFVVKPIRSRYTAKDEWLNEIGVHSTFWHDLYIILAAFDNKTEQITLKMHINPTVKFVWTSLVIMVLGALVGLAHRVPRGGSGDSKFKSILRADPENESKASLDGINIGALASVSRAQKIVGAFIVVFAILICAFGISGIAMAQSPQPELKTGQQQPKLFEVSPEMQAIGKDLRCPTCQGISILESETPQSVAMKIEIEKQLKEGRSKKEILSFFKQRYGDWILREPDVNSSYGFWIWILPIFIFILGPLLIIISLKKSKSHVNQTEVLKQELSTFIQLARTQQESRMKGNSQ